MIRISSRYNQARILETLPHNKLRLRAYNVASWSCEGKHPKILTVDLDGGPYMAINQIWKIDDKRYRILSFDSIEAMTTPEELYITMGAECIEDKDLQ